MQPVIINVALNQITSTQGNFTTALFISTEHNVKFMRGSSLEDFIGVPPEGIPIDSKVYKSLENFFSQGNTEVCIWGFDTVADPVGLEQAMLTELEGKPFYFMASDITTGTVPEAQVLIDYANTHGKIFAVTPDITLNSSAIITGAEIVNSDRVMFIPFNGTPGDTPTYFDYSASWLGEFTKWGAGQQNPAYRVLNAVPVNPHSTADRTSYEDSETVNWVQDVKGDLCMLDGVATSGQYVDITQVVDYTKDLVETAIVTLFKSSRPLAFDGIGYTRLVGALSGVAKRLVDERLVRGTPVIFVPQPSDVPKADRDKRIWTGIKFSFAYVGKVNQAEILINMNT